MTKHFFLATSLPELSIEHHPHVSFEDLMIRFEMNLSPKELESVSVIRKLSDLENALEVLSDGPIEPFGNLDLAELREAIAEKALLPDYFFEYLNEYEDIEQQRRNFSKVIVQFFHEEIEAASGFLKEYLMFERALRLVLLGYRSKKLGRDLDVELQYEDTSDDLVMQILIQRDSSGFEFPYEYKALDEALSGAENDPWKQFQSINHFRFERFKEASYNKPFSLDAALIYMVQLRIIQRLYSLNDEGGQIAISRILHE